MNHFNEVVAFALEYRRKHTTKSRIFSFAADADYNACAMRVYPVNSLYKEKYIGEYHFYWDIIDNQVAVVFNASL